jgi:Lysozyme like domain
MTFQEIEQTWINNGGNPVLAPVMAAIAWAESGGDPSNTTGDNGTSYGLWQIHWTVHPQFNPALLTNPDYNAQAAIQLSGNGQYLHPWTTFNNGAYKQYLGGAAPATSSNTQEAGFPNPLSGLWNTATNPAVSGPLGWLLGLAGGATSWSDFVDRLESQTIVTLAALTFIFIGGIWIIFGNDNTKQIVMEKASAVLA